MARGRTQEPSPQPSRGTTTTGPAGNLRPSASPLIGALIVGSVMLAAALIITYTIVPLPGQRGLGWWNYLAAGALFLGSLILGTVNDGRLTRSRP